MRIVVTLLVLIVLAFPACGSDDGSGRPACAAGAERCTCKAGNVCNAGLVCLSQTCVVAGTGGSGGGAGTSSGGSAGASSGGSAGTSSGGNAGATSGGSAGTAGTGGVDAGPQQFAVSITSPTADAKVQDSECTPVSTVTLTAIATDPYDPSSVLTYTWSATSYNTDNTVYAGPFALGTGASTTWQPGTVPNLAGSDKYSATGQKIVISVHVTDGKGNYGDASVTVYYFYGIC